MQLVDKISSCARRRTGTAAAG